MSKKGHRKSSYGSSILKPRPVSDHLIQALISATVLTRPLETKYYSPPQQDTDTHRDISPCVTLMCMVNGCGNAAKDIEV